MLDKIKELTKDTAVYGISTIVGRFFNFLLVPFYTNVFSTSDYGIAFLIYAYLAFFNIIYIYGMDAAFMKYTSLAEGDKKRDTFSTPYLIVSITSAAFTIVLLVVKEPLSGAMNIPETYSYILFFVIFILLFDTQSLIPFANLRLERKAVKFAALKIINIIINLSANIILILVFDFGIEAIFISNLLASGITYLLLLPEIFKRLKFRIQGPILLQMLKFGLPYLPASLASMVVQMIDTPILERLTDTSTLGIYKANYKLGIFMMLFVSMFNYAWQPFFLNNAKEQNAKEIFSKVLTLFLIVSSFIWLVLSLFIENIARLEIFGRSIIGTDYLEGLYIVPVVLLGYLFYGIYINFTAGIYIEEKTKYFPYITGAGALVNVAVNLIFIPVWGIMGAAVATLVSYLVMAAGLFFVSQKFYKIDYEYGKIAGIILLLTLSILSIYFINNAIGLTLTYKIIIFAVFLFALFALRIININDVKKTFNIFLKRN